LFYSIDIIELLLPYEFYTLEYSWLKATIGIFTLADYSVAKKRQQCTTWIGSPFQFLYPKRIKIRGCVLIILILIKHAKKIPSGYPGMIKLWIPQPVVAF
jgi:hypothetical protein